MPTVIYCIIIFHKLVQYHRYIQSEKHFHLSQYVFAFIFEHTSFWNGMCSCHEIKLFMSSCAFTSDFFSKKCLPQPHGKRYKFVSVLSIPVMPVLLQAKLRKIYFLNDVYSLRLFSPNYNVLVNLV